jgi:nitrite reductase/ring-hydroxylating ferredoxin subunit/uncharacterized membrane protein
MLPRRLHRAGPTRTFAGRERGYLGIMQPFDAIPVLERAKALDPLTKRLRAVVRRTIPSRRVQDILHGVWLGHPLHPALVLTPIGAWTSAAVLDLLPGRDRSARTLVGLGLLTAGPTAATGLADWSQARPEQQRVGLVHALANSTAAGLYGASYVARLRDPAAGRLLSLAGLGAVLAGGMLGGHLSFRQALGANHAEGVPYVLGRGWRELGHLDELPDGKAITRQVDGVPLFVRRRGTGVTVLAARCSHLAGPLPEGDIVVDPDSGVECVEYPRHGSTFRLADGAVVHGPAISPQPVFSVRVLDGLVSVAAEESR